MHEYFFFSDINEFGAQYAQMQISRKQKYSDPNVAATWPRYGILSVARPNVEFSLLGENINAIRSFISFSENSEIEMNVFANRHLPQELWGHLAPLGFLGSGDPAVVTELLLRDNNGMYAVIDVYSLNIAMLCARKHIDEHWSSPLEDKLSSNAQTEKFYKYHILIHECGCGTACFTPYKYWMEMKSFEEAQLGITLLTVLDVIPKELKSCPKCHQKNTLSYNKVGTAEITHSDMLYEIKKFNEKLFSENSVRSLPPIPLTDAHFG